MKHKILMFILCFVLNVNAQKSEAENVKAKIIEFFDAFHKQDTSALKAMVTEKIILQSISINKEGKTILKESEWLKLFKLVGYKGDYYFSNASVLKL